jgi:RNA polymerase sigma-70 factor (ECF subfamily)
MSWVSFVSDVYFIALRGAPSLDPDELRRWLFRVTVNRCHLEHRRRTRSRKLFGQFAAWRALGATPAGREYLEQDEERRLIREALHRLPLEMRAVLVMRYSAEMDSTDIGRILELPGSTVRSHLKRARNALANELEKLGYDHE